MSDWDDPRTDAEREMDGCRAAQKGQKSFAAGATFMAVIYFLSV